MLQCQRYTDKYFYILTNRFKDGDIIETPDAENKTLILHDLSEADSGLYRCRVHNDAGCVYSDEANLTVTGRLLQRYLNVMGGPLAHRTIGFGFNPQWSNLSRILIKQPWIYKFLLQGVKTSKSQTCGGETNTGMVEDSVTHLRSCSESHHRSTVL